MKKIPACLFLLLFFCCLHFRAIAQNNYFIDGYHGGIYGHYPSWFTKFITTNLRKHKNWKINLEIEPESWDTIQAKDPSGYAAIKPLINDSSDDVAIEYVNPSYAQSYLYNISGESIIRQFQYGMQKLKLHFPAIKFTTYSCEEPCFTSALPQILKSLGFKYVSLKNPNTCWGGYVIAHGGESLNWIGPDGTAILTVPRYTSERLQKRSTWQTIAWNNSINYLTAAFNQGIQYPVGMCFQDAGWKNGPWLGDHKLASTHYTTWRGYFKLIENQKNIENWRLSQEDIEVSLVWGSQILQRIAQQVRKAENKITMAEKTAALAKLYAGKPYPEKKFEEAWRTLLLSQHHDCWIVPYNIHDGKTWAIHVKEWTNFTDSISDAIIQQSLNSLSKRKINDDEHNFIVFKTTALKRNEISAVRTRGNSPEVKGVIQNGKYVPSQIIVNEDSSRTILFKAAVPPLSYSSFTLVSNTQEVTKKGASITYNKDGDYVMETDLYKLVVSAHHGNIKQLIAKNLGNKNFVPDNAGNFNGLRGYFYKDTILAKSTDQQPILTVIENGPLRIKLQIEGTINNNRFVQTIAMQQGEKRIDCSLHINYKTGTGIGENYKQVNGYYSTDRHKAFYNDTSKLIATFPLNLKNQKVYKDAPLDVTESKLHNTFYSRWDSIKNNVIDNWVDVTDNKNEYGMVLMSDHVTSYSHGGHFPLALTVQYAGIGLWGKNYSVDGSSDIHYALLPHKGKWSHAGINSESIKWNQPILTSIKSANLLSNAFVEQIDNGIAVSAMYYQGNDLYIRLVNDNSIQSKHKVSFNCDAEALQFLELSGKVKSEIKLKKNQKVSFGCEIPLFGFMTVRLVNARP